VFIPDWRMQNASSLKSCEDLGLKTLKTLLTHEQDEFHPLKRGASVRLNRRNHKISTSLDEYEMMEYEAIIHSLKKAQESLVHVREALGEGSGGSGNGRATAASLAERVHALERRVDCIVEQERTRDEKMAILDRLLTGNREMVLRGL
jgi:hypothetical protein